MEVTALNSLALFTPSAVPYVVGIIIPSVHEDTKKQWAKELAQGHPADKNLLGRVQD